MRFSFKKYIQEKTVTIIIKCIIYIFIFLMLRAFKVNESCTFVLLTLLVVFDVVSNAFDFYKKKAFFDKFYENMEGLDKKYLIFETMDEAGFQETDIFLDAIADISKCAKDEINVSSKALRDYKEYIEMWVHEIKLPLSSLLLMNFNKNKDYAKEKQKLDAMNMYLEQILFYARSGDAEKDYILNKVNLENVVNNVVKLHKDLFIGNRIRVIKENVNLFAFTDSKWMEFIIGQIVANSIKYKKDIDESYIKFTGIEEKEKQILIIEDNGIGINKADINRVFEKSFTGANGRVGKNSTGMGLYLCNKLCKKLGHIIRIESIENEYTRVFIEISKHDFYTFE